MLITLASPTGAVVPGVASQGLACVKLHPCFLEGWIHMIICGKANSFTIEVTFILKQT